MTKELIDILKVTDNAKNYLHNKNKFNISIEYPEYRTGNDCAFVQVPEIFAMKPKKEGEYHLITIDGINVYLSRIIKIPNNDIIIDITSFLGMKFLTVSGFNSKD